MELLENAPTADSKQINFKKEFKKYIKKWPWFLLSVLLFYAGAKIYLRYAQPQYFSKTSVKLRESKSASGSALGDLKSLGMGVSGSEELQGETTVVISKPILNRVAQNRNLDVSFFAKGNIKEIELYDDSPLTGKVIGLDEPLSFGSAVYMVNPAGKNSYRLSGIDGGGDKKNYLFGVPYHLPFGTVQLDIKPGFEFSSPIKVVFQNLKNVAAALEGSIGVALPENKGLLMELSMVGPVPKKSEDILNELTKQYIIEGVTDKNTETQNTQDFINDRLAIITEDLGGIENQKESFKRANRLTDIESQANLAVADANENTKALFGYHTQLDLINSMISASAGDQLLPSGMGLPAAVESSVSKYNDLLMTRNRVLKQATNVNPAVIEMNKEIASVKNLIRRNLLESRATLELQLAQANARINVANENISKYPTQEKVFRNIERQQTLKEQLYLYLLQKREENAITLAVTAPKAKVVNPAFTTGIVKPNGKQIIMSSLGAGFLLPALFFFVLFSLDTKIQSKEDILHLVPNSTVIGEIPEKEEGDTLVHPKDFSVFAESFRILSSNLRFILKAKNLDNRGVILITSSIKGEGKTTVAMNTALTLGSKTKVIVVGADIRNPQLHRYVKGKNYGLTEYLVSDDVVPDAYIKPSGIGDNVDVLFSGAIAPNPNDLLDMQKFDDLIEYLKTKYSYVVLDSAPVMLVSDTLHLIENADMIIYVTKSDFTEKEMMDFADNFKKSNFIKNMAFVINAVRPQNTKYGKKYGYGYYSYGNEHLTQKKRKFF